MCEVGSGTGGGVMGGHNVPHSGQVLLQPPEGALEGAGSPGVLQEADALCQRPGARSQVLHHAVPVPEAGVAGLAGGEGAREAPCALIAAHAGDARPAVTVAAATVALGTGDATGVTVAGCGDSGVSVLWGLP